MDDTENNNDSTTEHTYTDIEEVTFEKKPLTSSLSSAIGTINPLMGSLLNIALSGMTDDLLVKASEDSKTKKEFEELVKEIRQDEAQSWSAISRIADHTSVLIYIYNGTNETFRLLSSSWDNSVVPAADYNIEPWDYTSFILRCEPPKFSSGRSNRSTQAKHGFIYKSGNLAFDFTTLVKLTRPYDAFSFAPKIIPHREHKINSVGSASLKCSSRITQTVPAKPYSYSVVINVG